MFVLVPMPCSSCASGNCRVIASTEVPQHLPTTQLQAQGSAYGLSTRPDACALWGVTGCHTKGNLQHNIVLHHRSASSGAGMLASNWSQVGALDQKILTSHELRVKQHFMSQSATNSGLSLLQARRVWLCGS